MPNSPIKIIQCDDDGNEIRIFDSASDAAKSFGNLTPNWVRKAARNGTKAFGYRWKYYGTELKIKKTGTPGKKRSILAWKESDQTKLVFPSLSQAARELHLGVTSIEDALLNGRPRKGYYFQYTNEETITKYKKHRKPLVAIDDDDNVVHEYPSVAKAAESLSVSPSALYFCLRPGFQNHRCKGFRWRYKQNLECK